MRNHKKNAEGMSFYKRFLGAPKVILEFQNWTNSKEISMGPR